jgi:hypothetical protein
MPRVALDLDLGMDPVATVTAGPLWSQIADFVDHLPQYWDGLNAYQGGSGPGLHRGSRRHHPELIYQQVENYVVYPTVYRRASGPLSPGP